MGRFGTRINSTEASWILTRDVFNAPLHPRFNAQASRNSSEALAICFCSAGGSDLIGASRLWGETCLGTGRWPRLLFAVAACSPRFRVRNDVVSVTVATGAVDVVSDFAQHGGGGDPFFVFRRQAVDSA